MSPSATTARKTLDSFVGDPVPQENHRPTGHNEGAFEMSSVTEGNVRPDDRDAGTETNEKGKAVCEACGKPATRQADLDISVHWRDVEGNCYVDDGCDDEFTLTEAITLCDDCDCYFEWETPFNLRRQLIRQRFEAYVPEKEEDDQAQEECLARHGE